MPKVRKTRSVTHTVATEALGGEHVSSEPSLAKEHGPRAQELIQDFRQMCSSATAPPRDGDAQRMEAYMRNQFKFFGLKSPLRKKLQLSFVQDHANDLQSRVLLLSLCSALWDESEREFQYFSVDLLRQFRQELLGDGTPAMFWGVMNCIQRLITTKSWWDTVDALAYPGTKLFLKGVLYRTCVRNCGSKSHVCVSKLTYTPSPVVGYVVDRCPTLGVPLMQQWIGHDNMWLRRTAILHQVCLKKRTDEARLFTFCLARASEKEFFICKAIGWALRDYSKWNPQAVKDFVEKNRKSLSSLSIKEALRRISCTPA